MLRACLNFHYKGEAPPIWIPAPSKPRDTFLTKDDLQKLLRHIEAPHIRLFVILGVTTSARMSAILDLTWDRVDFKGKTIDFIPPGRIKTNKGRNIVPMNTRAQKALQEAYAARLTDNV